MFWNSEFLITPPSHIDVLLRSEDTKLSDILFEEDILQETKTSNTILRNFLIKQETITELVENITQVTEEDCCDKSIYSRVHAAYVSCEILTACSQEILEALIRDSESLNKIISCLTLRDQKVVPQKATLISKLISNLHSTAPSNLSCHITKNIDTFSALIKVLVKNIDISGSYEILNTFINITYPFHQRFVFCEILSKFNLIFDLIDVMTSSKHEDKQRNACQLLCDIIVIGRQDDIENIDGPAQDMLVELMESRKALEYIMARIFPPEITNSHCNGLVPEQRLSDEEKSNPSETVNGETESNEDETDEKTTKIDSDAELNQTETDEKPKADEKDEKIKENNIIKCSSDENTDEVKGDQSVGVQEAERTVELVKTEKTDQISTNESGDLEKSVELTNGVDEKLVEPTKPVSSDEDIQNHCTTEISNKDDKEESSDGDKCATSAPNATAILCSIKVLQTLVEMRPSIVFNNNSQVQHKSSSIARTIEQIQDVVSDYLINFHELLLNPPKQDPIKTTFGVIQKPLGYMRLEVVNLIRALLSTNSPVIIRKLVELNTMKVIMDLFIEYSWNNLLHTQVERALCLIIKNCRYDEDQPDMKDLSEENGNEKLNMDDIPSRALLSQLLNECDLIGRLLLHTRNDEQANFGHIIQIINSIAINCDLDTIQGHLNAMKDERPELYDRWTSFVNVDVASFKEISLYCDVHTLNNHVEERDKQHHYLNSQHNHHSHNTLSNNNGPSSNNTSENFNSRSLNGDDRELMAYLLETVIPSINVDVLPKARRSTKTNNY